MLKASDVTVQRNHTVVVSGVSLEVAVGESLGIIGPNGSGKSSFLFALSKILPCSSGFVTVYDKDINTLSRKKIARTIASVLQETEQVLPLSVYDVVALGRLPSNGIFNYDNIENAKIVTQALERVELLKHSKKLITELSGGERQRVMIARAIAQQAAFLLLDEPTNHLDLRHQLGLIDLLKSLDSGNIIVLHDINLASQCCDKILLMSNGKPFAFGTPHEVLTESNIKKVYKVNATKTNHNGKPHLLFDSLDPFL